MRQLKKVCYDGKRVKVAYEIVRKAGEPDEFNLNCSDPPHPSLLASLAALKDAVREICGLPAPWCQGLLIRGVSFSWAGDDNMMGATITALKPLTTANAPLVINTPHLPAEPYSKSEGAKPPLLPDCAVGALDLLRAAAFDYVDGKRAQVEIFAGEAGKVPQPAAPAA